MPKSASKKKRSSVASTTGSKSSAVTVASVKGKAPTAAEKSKAKKRGRKVDVPPLTKGDMYAWYQEVLVIGVHCSWYCLLISMQPRAL